jgi:sarcosine oxidase
LPAGWEYIFQPDGGVLLPEKAIRLFVALAKHGGATVRVGTPVKGVQPIGDAVRITLEDGGRLEAGAVVVAAGPWIGDLVPELRERLRLTRQPLLWFSPMDRSLVQPDRMPVFLLQSHEDLTYGLPDLCGSGVKAASHLSCGELESADAPRAVVSDDEKAAIRSTLQRYVPAAAGEVNRTSLCIYTRSPDGHFVLGHHPEAPQIIIASPCSGHGFKFASIIGEILTDLATDGNTNWPIELFTPERIPWLH